MISETMSYRKKVNNYDSWKKLCFEYKNLLDELPQEAIHNEKSFRQFVTYGDMKKLSNRQVCNLWDFIHRVAQFDMDAILFDTFNQEYLIRIIKKEHKLYKEYSL